MATRIVEEHRRGLSAVGHPSHSALLPVPILCFVGALATDLAYARTEDFMWLNFSSWLHLAGQSGDFRWAAGGSGNREHQCDATES